ncbi:exonuclease SbcCD subunit D [Microbacteriaceae bacterium VKM Ac-2855]|nr:exonuclease SbcCD subunit D [Microbacteriaceae bacterium VKM Ac-2855]
MRLLHTSDWHIGRTFHGHSTVSALRDVLAALVNTVATQRIDVVLIAGDVFDSALPAAEHYTLLSETLVALRDAGAVVVVTSGNHDSAARLGFQSAFLGRSGVHVITQSEQILEPVELNDEHGPVLIYGIPYLEPSLFRHRHPEAALRRHDEVLDFVMSRIRADAAERGGRSVVLAHCFAVGVAAESSADVERDITAGGLDYVALERFDGPDYVALGHIHGRAVLRDAVRYSGAPLHYSFGEGDKPRGGWIIELGATGFAGAEWSPLPVPRRLTRLEGTLDELLNDPSNTEYEEDWVFATLTDALRPLDAMARLQSRFPHCAALEHRPPVAAIDGPTRYATRIRGRSDAQIVGDFLAHVRNGVGATPGEATIITDTLAEIDAEATR